MNLVRKLMTSRKAKTIVFSSLTALYAAGLIAMFFSLALGVLLWAATFIPSLAIFILQKQFERDEEVEKAKNEALKADDDNEEA